MSHPSTGLEDCPEQTDIESPVEMLEIGDVTSNNVARLRCKYSTTSSVYTKDTLACPDSERVLYW